MGLRVCGGGVRCLFFEQYQIARVQSVGGGVVWGGVLVFFEQDGSNPEAEVAGPDVCQVDETAKPLLAGPTIPRLTAPLAASSGNRRRRLIPWVPKPARAGTA